MKTLTKLLLAMACVCLLIACSKSDDNQGVATNQLKSTGEPDNTNPGTGTYVYDFFVDGMYAHIPVYCNGELVDWVTGGFYTLGVRDHYQKGELTWEYVKSHKLILTSDNTGEIFTNNGIERYRVRQGMDILNANMKGNMGSHYIQKIWTDWETWTLVDVQSVCH